MMGIGLCKYYGIGDRQWPGKKVQFQKMPKVTYKSNPSTYSDNIFPLYFFSNRNFVPDKPTDGAASVVFPFAQA
jgi:hypothetical protein